MRLMANSNPDARPDGAAASPPKKIALEEHFLCPGLEDYWTGTVANVDPQVRKTLSARLHDFDELRISTMDEAGIARAVLSVSGPGVQVERNAAEAVRRAREANDFLAKQIQKRPARYSGFAHLALQDPLAAANELERCVRDLRFCGAMINGHTNGMYLDHPSFYPFWERAEALSALIYIHPADPIEPIAALSGHPGLQRATWGWGFETGSHALRLVFGGTFDRFPRARLALGHLGETLPFLLWRLDGRARLYGVKLDKRPSDYIKENIVVTMSGMYSPEPLLCTIAALGADRVMFSADYPFESMAEAGEFMDTVALSNEIRAQIAYRNAESLLRLPV
jgi:2,3-dihydroxybenzoate decarboxylase